MKHYMMPFEHCKHMETTSYCSNRPLEYDSYDQSYQSRTSYEAPVPHPEEDLHKKVHNLFNRDHVSLRVKAKLDRRMDLDKVHDGEWGREHEF